MTNPLDKGDFPALVVQSKETNRPELMIPIFLYEQLKPCDFKVLVCFLERPILSVSDIYYRTGMSRAAARKAIKRLVDAKIIQGKCLEPSFIESILRQKKPSFGIGHKACLWCQSITSSLEEHHYPVSRKEGGINTVLICRNCHVEYHYAKESKLFSLTQSILDQINLLMNEDQGEKVHE